MGRKVMAFWLSLAMVLSLIVVLDVIIDFTSPVKGGIIRYVNETGTGGAYTKIQDAINASSDGDTVFVYNGTYYENVVLNKSINLTGENFDNTIIDGKGTGEVIYVCSNWVNIENFSITNSGSDLWDAGIKVENVQNCGIYNNNISFNHENGIYFSVSDNNVISNNTISNNELDGIHLRSSSEFNIIFNNRVFSNERNGIHVEYSSENNIINNNLSSNNQYGLYLYTTQTIITNNTFNNDGIIIRGSELVYFNTHSISTTNTVMDNPIYYYRDISGININGWPAGQIILANCYNINVNNTDINFADAAMQIIYSSNINITNNNINSNDWWGIYLKESNSNRISDNNFKNDRWSIDNTESDDIIITNNTMLNSLYGIRLTSSLNNNISNNNIIDSEVFGIRITQSSSNILVENNTISSIKGIYGIRLSSSFNINITQNKLINDGIYLDGGQLAHFNTHNISTDNLINNKPVYYYKDSKDININGIHIGEVILANCTAFNISDLILNNTDVGIEIAYSKNITIASNTIFNSTHSIVLFYSTNNNITNNDISLIYFNGVHLQSSSYNNFSDNYLFNNNEHGFYFTQSSYNNILNNSVIDNIGSGLYISWSSNFNIIDNNIINNSEYGLTLIGSQNDNLVGNNILSNQGGINILITSPNNKIYHNNFINNANQVIDDTTNGNQWDNGYPSGGNYWSDFDEPSEGAYDDYHGSDQNVSGSDGIVDNGTIGGGGKNPYVIDADSWDNYPLIKPYKNCMILKQGWNLISIPLAQQEQNLIKVLASIDGLYDAVQWYDNKDLNDPWKHHKVDKPFGNDLFEINETMGFWIHITHPGDTIFLYNGTQPTQNQTITLYPGWNLVGYPSFTSYNRTNGLNNLTFGMHVDSIWTYNAATQKWKELGPSDYFAAGKGYWVHAQTPCVWEVPL